MWGSIGKSGPSHATGPDIASAAHYSAAAAIVPWAVSHGRELQASLRPRHGQSPAHDKPAADPQDWLYMGSHIKVQGHLGSCRPTSRPHQVTAQPMTNAAADLHYLLYMGPRCRPTGLLLYMGSHLEVQGHLGAAAQGLPIIVGDGEGAACLGLPDVLLVVIVLGDDLQGSRNRALLMWCGGLSWLHTMHWLPCKTAMLLCSLVGAAVCQPIRRLDISCFLPAHQKAGPKLLSAAGKQPAPRAQPHWRSA